MQWWILGHLVCEQYLGVQMVRYSRHQLLNWTTSKIFSKTRTLHHVSLLTCFCLMSGIPWINHYDLPLFATAPLLYMSFQSMNCLDACPVGDVLMFDKLRSSNGSFVIDLRTFWSIAIFCWWGAIRSTVYGFEIRKIDDIWLVLAQHLQQQLPHQLFISNQLQLWGLLRLVLLLHADACGSRQSAALLHVGGLDSALPSGCWTRPGNVPPTNNPYPTNVAVLFQNSLGPCEKNMKKPEKTKWIGQMAQIYTAGISILGHLSMICFYFEFVGYFQAGRCTTTGRANWRKNMIYSGFWNFDHHWTGKNSKFRNLKGELSASFCPFFYRKVISKHIKRQSKQNGRRGLQCWFSSCFSFA